VQKEHALDQVQRVDDEQVVLAVAAAHDQPVEGREQALGNVPLEALLQLEELAEGRVARKVGEHLAGGLVSVAAVVGALFPRAARPREADLCEKPFDLFQALFDLAAVKGREVVKSEG
jgi:hypothetical protein